MADNPLKSLKGYSQLLAELLDRPTVSRSTPFPHHKHVPPDIKHHRVLAPGMSFTQPNLPMLLREIEALIEQATNEPDSERA